MLYVKSRGTHHIIFIHPFFYAEKGEGMHHIIFIHPCLCSCEEWKECIQHNLYSPTAEQSAEEHINTIFIPPLQCCWKKQRNASHNLNFHSSRVAERAEERISQSLFSHFLLEGGKNASRNLYSFSAQRVEKHTTQSLFPHCEQGRGTHQTIFIPPMLLKEQRNTSNNFHSSAVDGKMGEAHHTIFIPPLLVELRMHHKIWNPLLLMQRGQECIIQFFFIFTLSVEIFFFIFTLLMER